MTRRSRLRSIMPALAIGLALSLGIADVADAARRGGGGFGSRGARTYQVPRTTNTAPQAARPVERTMTPTTAAQRPGAARPTAGQPGAQARRPGFLGGLAGGMLGGLLLGGLVGMLMGNGLGGMAGFLGLLLQAGVIALVIMLAFKFLRRRREPAMAGAGAPMQRDYGHAPGPRPLDPQPRASTAGLVGRPAGAPNDEIGIKDEDFDVFERLLGEIQNAYGREDYGTLRERTTPEVMGFLAEELANNATQGRRNEIRDVKLLQGDLSEAWNEGDAEYATVAVRYQSVDVVRDRQTGQVIEGDPDRAVETTEVWTFRRDGGAWGGGSGWKLSAVQEV